MVFSNFVWCCAKYGKVSKVFRCFSFESALKVGLGDAKKNTSLARGDQVYLLWNFNFV